MATIGRTFFSGPRRLVALFVLVSGIPMVAIGWLGWRSLEQERDLEAQRLEDQLENSANLLVRELEQGLTAWEDLLSVTVGDGFESVTLPPGTLLLRFDEKGILDRHGIPLPYYPLVHTPAEAPAEAFRAAETLEFRDGDLDQAAVIYRQLTDASDPRVQAGALMRLARTLRGKERLEEALSAYGELALLADIPVARAPAELVARRERIALLTATGQTEASSKEKALLAEALSEARYLLDQTTFDFYADSVSVSSPRADPGFRLAGVVRELWPLWQQQAKGRTGWRLDDTSFVATWNQAESGGTVMLGSIDALTGPAEAMLEDLNVRLALEDPEGRSSWGGLTDTGSQVVRTARETGLPWTVRVESSDVEAALQAATERRNLLAAGFVLMALVTGTAGYAAVRALRRETGVARLQSEFVAAVSHEFRTPLTAMRHLTDMLEDGRASSERMPRYFQALGSETRRLQAMVENLLDFARMEAGRRTYDLEDVNAEEFAKGIVETFHEHAATRDQAVEFLASPESDAKSEVETPIRADRHALALALGNLIENALKYSPQSSRVRVSVKRKEGTAGIAVRDEGPGIPKSEQQSIFRKFVRGGGSATHEVKGTGIGLTIAQQIVEAHGGNLELDSEPGSGSCFTMWLPSGVHLT